MPTEQAPIAPAFGTLPDLLPRIGGMATMPSRLEVCLRVLPRILSQVDRLYLYLDKFESIPDHFADVPKLVAMLPSQEKLDVGGTGKFLALKKLSNACLFFGFDDDILYPPEYVSHLCAALRRHRYQAIVGFHAAVYDFPVGSYVRDRRVLHFRNGLELDCCVDELGTGTLAFHSLALTVDWQRWEHNKMNDLMLMIEAVRQQVPRIAVWRPARFLRPLAENQTDSLYRTSRRDDSVQTRLLQEAQALYPDRWCRSTVATRLPRVP